MTSQTNDVAVPELDVFVNVHVKDIESIEQAYAKIFPLECLIGPTQFFDDVTWWKEWELPIEEGLITLRFVAGGDAKGQFKKPEFVLLSDPNLATLRDRAAGAGFSEISQIEDRGPYHLVRMIDPAGNRVVVTNKSAWRKT